MDTITLNENFGLELGIFAKTFQRPSVDEVFDAVASYGLTCTQWNWACVPGLPSLPEFIPTETMRSVARAAARSGVRIAAISATFNILDPVARERGLARLPLLAEAAVAVGCQTLTLCTGTRHPADMWTWHPGNSAPAAWIEMIDALRKISRIALQADVRFAMEPETANVVSDAASAASALHELDLDGLPFSIILDAANLYRPPNDPRVNPEVIDDAVALLGEYISIAHAKDIDPPAGPSAQSRDTLFQYRHVAVGKGILPYPHYLTALLRVPEASDGTRLPLVLHSLDESEVATSVAFLRQSMRNLALA